MFFILTNLSNVSYFFPFFFQRDKPTPCLPVIALRNVIFFSVVLNTPLDTYIVRKISHIRFENLSLAFVIPNMSYLNLVGMFIIFSCRRGDGLIKLYAREILVFYT